MKLNSREPDFTNMLKVLHREAPSRPTLFEFFLNHGLFATVTGRTMEVKNRLDHWRWAMAAYHAIGHDYVVVEASAFGFPRRSRDKQASVSLNEGFVITDRASFDAYGWPQPREFPSWLDALAMDLPAGMKLMILGPMGVLENVIGLMGFDNLCMFLADDPALVADIFDAVGSRLVRYYQLHASHPAVGACISNDDWGFKTQTMISPADLRKYVFPWHQRIVEVIHAAGKPAILHSCGQLAAVMDDVIDVLKFDGKHSYEDNITPVEDAYTKWGQRIAILGGIDVDFLCRAPLESIRQRSRRLLELTGCRGYALGSGNSIPEYVPDENYLAMVEPAIDG